MRTTKLRTAIATAAATFTVALSFGSLSTTNAGASVAQSADATTMTAQSRYDSCVTRTVCSYDSNGVRRCRRVTFCRTTQA